MCPLSTVVLEELELVLMRSQPSAGARPRGMKPGEPKTTTSSSGELEQKRSAGCSPAGRFNRAAGTHSETSLATCVRLRLYQDRTLLRAVDL